MRKQSNSAAIFNSTIVSLLIGGVIFVTGYAVSLRMLRSNIIELTNKSVSSEIGAINNYIDSQLRIVEEISYAISWAEDRHGAYFRQTDYATEEQMFTFLENVLKVHPSIYSIGIGLYPGQNIYPQYQYGYAIGVIKDNSTLERLLIGDFEDYTEKEWFKYAYESNDVYWGNPFCTTANQIVACFSLPLRDQDGNPVGVLVLNYDLKTLYDHCQDITSLDDDVVTILDHNLQFVSHPDSSMLFTDAFENDSEHWQAMLKQQQDGVDSGMVTGMEGGKEYALYFSRVERTGWIICVECPLEEIFSNVKELRSKVTAIAILSVLIVALCFILLYRRFRHAMLEKSSIEADMRVAEDLQMGLLPKKQPAFPDRNDMDIYGFLQPAKMVGGDMYDYLLRDDKLFFCIGDVSGKGVPAAMFMSVVVSHFHNMCKKADSTLELVSSLNELLASENSENMFCTLFLGILNLRNGRLDYCNAGHEEPVLIRKTADGYEAELLPGENNLVVGALDDFVFTENYTTMRPGDSLFLFTDGVTEAENKDRDLFGVEATVDSIGKIFNISGNESAEKKVTRMLEEIHRHTGGTTQSDDITMLLVEYKGETITLENRIEQLPLLSDFVKSMCGKYGIAQEIIDDLEVAMDEIGANIVMYAFPNDETHTYNVSFHHEAGELVFTFEDDGVPFDPTQPTESHLDLPPEDRPLGGLGIMMVKEMMDKVEYERRGNFNVVCIVKKY